MGGGGGGDATAGGRSPHLAMTYRAKASMSEKYKVSGFISSGTYGRVYKAVTRGRVGQEDKAPAGDVEFAIKKFKPEREGDPAAYTGISQSAVREMALCTELSHDRLVRLVEIMLEDRCIFMVFEYCQHDLLQIIYHHTQGQRRQIAASMIRSLMYQLLDGCHYLHTNWVMHRDLKPANIMVTASGQVKIGDLGLARLFNKPLHSLFSGDKVVVTIWYRAPELLLGSRHYTPAIDMWAAGCIFAELMSLRPIFKGEEAKIDGKKTVPFQRSQLQKIVDILGAPSKERWGTIAYMTDYASFLGMVDARHHGSGSHGYGSTPMSQRAGSQYVNHLDKWYYGTVSMQSGTTEAVLRAPNPPPLTDLGVAGLQLLSGLLEYDPEKRLTARQALSHPLFGTGGDRVSSNCFAGLSEKYPHRRVSQDDKDMGMSGFSFSKRNGLVADSLVSNKRAKAENWRTHTIVSGVRGIRDAFRVEHRRGCAQNLPGQNPKKPIK